MEFLKRHYEKVILLGLFVLFIALMVMVQGIISRTKEISDADLNLPKREANHVMADAKDKKFDPAYMWSETRLVWNDGAAREAQGKLLGFSDLVSVFPMASCPYCNDPLKSDKVTLVPLANFSSKDAKRNCPNCGHELPAPVARKKMFIGIKSENDLDGDGIPNEIERKYGMNPDNPEDALWDNDKDGFSNYFEIQNNFDPNNPGNHPPYWWRLRLKHIDQVELPIKFMAITDNGSADKKSWALQFNMPHRRIKNKIRSEYHWIGQTVTIEGRVYQIDDVEKRIEQVKSEDGSRSRQIDRTRVFLTEIVNAGVMRAPDKLTMVIGEPAKSSDKRPVMEDLGFPGGMTLTVYSGSKLYIGNIDHKNLRNDPTAGRYMVKDVDVEKNIVRIVDLRERAAADGSRTVIDITVDGRVPVEARPVQRSERSADEMAE